MNILHVGLLLVGGGLILLAVVSYSNSRKIYLQGKEMSRLALAVAAVGLLVSGLRSEILTLRDSSTGSLDQSGQNELAARLEALVGEAAPVADAPVEEDEEVIAEPVVENEEVVGGVLPNEPGSEAAPTASV